MAIVFVIHGMGKHSPGWWTGAQGTKSKVSKLKRFDSLREKVKDLSGLVEDIDWVELNYDSFSEKIRTAPEQDGQFDSLISLISADPNNSVPSENLAAWKNSSVELTQSLNPFNRTDFLKDNIWDVFLCSNKLTRHYLALQIADHILATLQEKGATEPWSVLAHSLGTALIQDVLNILFRELGQKDFIRAPRVVCLLANFSRTKIGNILVSQDPTTEETSVWPSKKVGQSMCRYYISARHKLDPLSYLGDEMPDPWQSSPTGFVSGCYRVLEHKDLNFVPGNLDLTDPVELGSYNHSLENYLAHPSIHLPFFYRALGMGSYVTSKIEKDATTDFLKTRKPTPLNFAKVIAENDLSSVKSWVEALAKIGDEYGAFT